MSSHVERVFRRVQHMLRIGITTTPAKAGKLPTTQVQFNAAQIHDAIPIVQQYGLTSMPPSGSPVVVVGLAGDAAGAMIIGSAHSSAPVTLTDGQVAIWDKSGSMVLLDGKGNIDLNPAGGIVTIKGRLVVTDDATIGGVGFVHHVHPGVQHGSTTTQAPQGGT
jgi:phage gp45-like